MPGVLSKRRSSGFPPSSRAAKKQRRKSYKPTENLQVTVIDEHNHAMLPVWRALKQRQIPRTGLKMLHFDSHPDLGCLEEDDDEMDRAYLNPKIFRGRFNEDDVLEASCIATWILTLIMQGVFDEVTWVAGHWCDQMRVGDYELLVGICKNSGNMKVASPGNKKMAILDYWHADGSVEREENLHSVRPWKLHVVKFNKNGKIPEKGKKRLIELFQTGEWILDIDEDYLSCNNPHGIEFRANFGEENYKSLQTIFDASCENYYQYWRRIEKITNENIYKLPVKQYFKNETVMEVFTQLQEEAEMSEEDARKTLVEYRRICLYVFPKKTDDKKFSTEDFYENKDIVETGEMSCVPHHITPMPHILKMINDTVDLFQRIPTRPLLATVATSRADRYLPDAQASMINTLVLRALRRTYGPGVKTYRRDKPENTAEDVEPTKEARRKELLFRKDRNGKRKPVSR